MCRRDERLHVLDRHHAANQRHCRRNVRAGGLQFREAGNIDAVGDHCQLLVAGTESALRPLVVLVQRDDLGPGLVAGAGIGLEGLDPHVAQVDARIVQGVALVDGVGDPIGHQQLDPTLVGIDAVLGQQRRPAGLDRGAGREDAGISGRDRVVGPGAGQLELERREQAAEQCPPGPEEVQERAVRHRPVVHSPDDVPADGRVEHHLRRDRRPQPVELAHDGLQGATASLTDESGQRVGERIGVDRLALADDRTAAEILQIEMIEPGDVVGDPVPGLQPGRTWPQRDDREARGRLGTDQPVDPARNTARHVRIAAFDDDADVALRRLIGAPAGIAPDLPGNRPLHHAILAAARRRGRRTV